jgi:hypothetical protein
MKRCAFLALILWAVAVRAADGAGGPPRVDVILWFDTEDYLLPACDDASKRLAEMLTRRGIRATFNVVGEKARVLEKRGRGDVIEALKKHDIGYHSNLHSVHPTPSEYLAECGLVDGVAEFARREGGGAADVRRVFGVRALSCYGQPGSSWAAQAIAALPAIGVATERGVPVYLDSGSHVGLGAQPFWFAGALVVYNMRENETRFDLHTPQALEAGKARVSAIAERLRGKGGGLISIFYHPSEWVHQRFWDDVNFRRGANPPREAWQAPPQRPANETEAAFERFGAYVDHIKAIEGVRFVTASELPERYPDGARAAGATKDDVSELALRIVDETSPGLNWQNVGGRVYSPADQFDLLTRAAAGLFGEGEAFPMAAAGLRGPDGGPPAEYERSARIPPAALRDALVDVRGFVKVNGRVPARVYVGATAVSPADFLYAVAGVWREHAVNGAREVAGARLPARAVAVLTEQHIAKDTPGLFGGWVIHREGFRAPRILEVARWQAWSLKPAVRE